ncbi:MAG TPA: hypothetical protein DDX92_02045 [Flavobacteriales bacterium]|jgi:uncharacterized membrane protein|nr:hypothetical protein [Flavobacteriales bacterium]
MSTARNFFTEQEKQRLKSAIKEAENNTSGEIRVHIEQKCGEDVLDRAAFLFGQLKMHETKLRNGVLFYLAISDHKFAILGDLGINNKVPEGFWDEIKDDLLENFKAGAFTEGLEKGIIKAGNQLKSHFPLADDDENELDDDITFDDEKA